MYYYYYYHVIIIIIVKDDHLLLSEVNAFTFNRFLPTSVTSSFLRLSFLYLTAIYQMQIRDSFLKYQCPNVQAAFRLLSSTFYSLDFWNEARSSLRALRCAPGKPCRYARCQSELF